MKANKNGLWARLVVVAAIVTGCSASNLVVFGYVIPLARAAETTTTDGLAEQYLKKYLGTDGPGEIKYYIDAWQRTVIQITKYLNEYENALKTAPDNETDQTLELLKNFTILHGIQFSRLGLKATITEDYLRRIKYSADQLLQIFNRPWPPCVNEPELMDYEKYKHLLFPGQLQSGESTCNAMHRLKRPRGYPGPGAAMTRCCTREDETWECRSSCAIGRCDVDGNC